MLWITDGFIGVKESQPLLQCLPAVELMSGSDNGDKFFDYVRGSLIHEMQSFDGENPNSVAVLDNCSIHHVQEVTQLFKDARILVLFLPPYSPDFMPIEKTFSFL